MLLVALALVSIFCAFWCTFMLRYPTAWSRRVDQHQRLLRSLGLDLPWMHRMERGRFTIPRPWPTSGATSSPRDQDKVEDESG
jgi:hypothetical protein